MAGFLKHLLLFASSVAVLLCELGTGAQVDKSKLEDLCRPATWFYLGEENKESWHCFWHVNVNRIIWELQLSKLDNMLYRLKFWSLSFRVKSLINNILGISKLLYMAHILPVPSGRSDFPFGGQK